MISTRFDALKMVLDEPIESYSSLSGGCVSDVYKIDFSSSPSLVVKVAATESIESLRIEGLSLEYLRENTPVEVPKVIYNDDGILLMEYVVNDSIMTAAAERNCALRFAELHQCSNRGFGFDFDTVIGGLAQPNPTCSSWLDFYSEFRILHMAIMARDAGNLDSKDFRRIEGLVNRLDNWLTEPSSPALVHGDAWSGNVLVKNDALAAVIDPACYYGDAEVDLAFSTMFGTFSNHFFERYDSLNPIREGFFEERKDLYLIYPILVHIRLFGGSYTPHLHRVLMRYGF